MKNVKLILSCLVALIALSVAAQNNNYNRNSSANFNGMNNNNTNTEFQNERRKAEVEKEKGKSIQRSITRLKTDLELDELQVIAISNIITQNVKKQNAILKKEEGSNEDKTNELKAISEKMDLDIMILLNKDQKVKYKLLAEDAKKQREAYSRTNR